MNPTRPLNAMTVDVEDYFHVSAFADVIHRDDWGSMQGRYEDNTARVLDLFAEASLRATFFVLGWVAERSPDLVRRIAAAGHEIACHGYSHQLIYRQTPAEFESETRIAKQMLEDITGARVTGYRAASYSITPQSLWALDAILDAGFEYDSSIFPIRHDRYGVPGARTEPHRLVAPSGRQIVEFPLSVARWWGITVPVAGGGYFRLLPFALTRAGLKKLESAGRPAVFYLHPWEIDPDQPRIAASLLSRFRHYTNLHKFEPRLKRLMGEFRFGTMREALSAIGLTAGNPRVSGMRVVPSPA